MPSRGIALTPPPASPHVGTPSSPRTSARLSTSSNSSTSATLGESCRDGLFSPAQLRSRPLEELHRQLEKEFLLQLHSDLGGDLKAMAGSLDITVRALYVRFRRLGIDVRRL